VFFCFFVHVEIRDTMCSMESTQILLLGSADSGKSAIIKQLRILTTESWTHIELESYRRIIFSNLIEGMKDIFESLKESGTSLEGDPRAFAAYKVGCPPLSSSALPLTSWPLSSAFWRPLSCEKAGHILVPVMKLSISSGHTLKSKTS
jgi:G-protein alpha subunit